MAALMLPNVMRQPTMIGEAMRHARSILRMPAYAFALARDQRVPQQGAHNDRPRAPKHPQTVRMVGEAMRCSRSLLCMRFKQRTLVGLEQADEQRLV